MSTDQTTIVEQIIPIPTEKETLPELSTIMLINAAAGNKPPAPADIEAQLMRQSRIDLSECLELIQAVVVGDIPELRDGLTDKRITLGGFATIMPFSLSEDFYQAARNQFTRFDRDYAAALATQNKYAKISVETYIEKNTVGHDGWYVNKVKVDCTGDDGEFYPMGKFLKSVNFIKDDFTDGDYSFIDVHSFQVERRWLLMREMLAGFISKMDAAVIEISGEAK